MDYNEPFSGYTIAEKLLAEGFRFNSKNPGLATTETLRTLVRKGILRVHRNGSGSAPTLYERVKQ